MAAFSCLSAWPSEESDSCHLVSGARAARRERVRSTVSRGPTIFFSASACLGLCVSGCAPTTLTCHLGKARSRIVRHEASRKLKPKMALRLTVLVDSCTTLRRATHVFSRLGLTAGPMEATASGHHAFARADNAAVELRERQGDDEFSPSEHIFFVRSTQWSIPRRRGRLAVESARAGEPPRARLPRGQRPRRPDAAVDARVARGPRRRACGEAPAPVLLRFDARFSGRGGAAAG